MAPPEEESSGLKETKNSDPDTRPISTIVIIIAMRTEALPLVNKFQLKEDLNPVFPIGVPWVRYCGTYKDLNISIIWPGKDANLDLEVAHMDFNCSYRRVDDTQKPNMLTKMAKGPYYILPLGVDSVGTISASLVTYASVLALQPDLIINAGTAGGFKAKGASIGDIFLASDVAFHDRRIPIPVFDLYGVGLREAFPTPNLLKTLNLKVGKLSTGDSLDTSTLDEASINSNDATIKDMEGAAVAYVADLLKVPAIFVKAVSDIVDGVKPTGMEFLQNLLAVTAALDQAVMEVVNFINGRCLSEL